MKILFMGTPDFALCSLEALENSRHQVVGVVCQGDKPKGRGMTVQMPPTKEFALSHQIPVFQPASLKNGELKDVLKAQNPDLIVVVAYGKLLPAYVLEYPRYGCINVHGSLLPKYRGSAPIQWSVIRGDSYGGVTTMYMAEKLDAGDILEMEKTPIGPDETSEDLYERLKVIGANLLLSTIDKLEKGMLTPIAQDESQVTYAPMLSKNMGNIDWTKSSREIKNLIRGLYSWPCAYTITEKGILKIYSASIEPCSSPAAPGTILQGTDGIVIRTGDGALRLGDVQLQGKKRMSSVDFSRGNPMKVGRQLPYEK